MEKQNNLNDRITDAIEDMKEYFNLRQELIQLNLIEKISIALSKMISTSVALIFFLLFILFGSFALAYCIGESLDHTVYGFAIVAGAYLLIGLIISIFANKSINRKLTDKFIEDFTNEQPNDKP